MSKCKICGKEGFHKLSCPNQKITLFLEDELEPARRLLGTDKLIEYFNKAIPTLEGDEAEEFVRKADEALKAEKTDWTLQSKRAERILEKSRIANRKLRYTKCADNIKRNKDVEP